MALWLSSELKDCDQDLRTLSQQLGNITAFQATSFALKLLDAKDAIMQRDFDALGNHPDKADSLARLMDAIRPRDDLHDKFWRYMELFVTSVDD